jgi:hypothetical protein
MNKKISLLVCVVALLALSNCSTYTIKADMSKDGVVERTPDWYVNYDRVTMFYYQDAAEAVSPDMDLAVKKSVILAKAKIADRINSEISNKTTVSKNENGLNENLTVQSGSQDLVVNTINGTLLVHYDVIKQEIYSTRDRSYRSYVMIRVSKKDIEALQSDLAQKRADKRG